MSKKFSPEVQRMIDESVAEKAAESAIDSSYENYLYEQERKRKKGAAHGAMLIFSILLWVASERSRFLLSQMGLGEWFPVCGRIHCAGLHGD